ncbi:MAG: hypothetical protein NUV97_04275 [archaeon]|nr:hypothetical protein [archaeon]MCR4323533.1 hypothetical protein [Nanoarchaeota archaeon]
MTNKYVWEFTNQRKLNKSEFLDYFERKVFRTIRKYDMLPKDKAIILKKSEDLNTTVLKKVLEKKFTVKFGVKPVFFSDNLSFVAEEIFKKILMGKFEGPKPENRPLYFLSDKEVELYAELVGLKGDVRKRDSRTRALFDKFLKKNQDLELNIVRALGQIV